jgi:hypothetical protein
MTMTTTKYGDDRQDALDSAERLLEWARGPIAEQLRAYLREKGEKEHVLTGAIASDGKELDGIYSGCRRFYLDAEKQGIGLTYRIISCAGFHGVLTTPACLVSKVPLNLLRKLERVLLHVRLPREPQPEQPEGQQKASRARVVSEETRELAELILEWRQRPAAVRVRHAALEADKVNTSVATVQLSPKDCTDRPGDEGEWILRLTAPGTGELWLSFASHREFGFDQAILSAPQLVQVAPEAVVRGFWRQLNPTQSVCAGLVRSKPPPTREERLERRLRRSPLRPLFDLIQRLQRHTFNDLVDEWVTKAERSARYEGWSTNQCEVSWHRSEQNCGARFTTELLQNQHGSWLALSLTCYRCGLHDTGAGGRGGAVTVAEWDLNRLLRRVQDLCPPALRRPLVEDALKWRSAVDEYGRVGDLLWAARILGATRGEVEALAERDRTPTDYQEPAHWVSNLFPAYEEVYHWHSDDLPFGAQARKVLEENSERLSNPDAWKHSASWKEE